MWHVLHELGTTFGQSRGVSGRAQHEAPGHRFNRKSGGWCKSGPDAMLPGKP